MAGQVTSNTWTEFDRKALLNSICINTERNQDVAVGPHEKVSSYVDIRVVACSAQWAPILSRAMRGLIETIVDLEADKIALVAPAVGGALVAMGINVVRADSGWPLGVHVFDPLSRSMTPELSLSPFEDRLGAENATKYVLVDDVSHTGKTLVDCLGFVSGGPETVLGVFSVVDRGIGARRRLADQGYELHSLFTLDEIDSHLQSGPRSDAR